ncbi:MAG: DoxX family protein [Patescibacteria group bacterium]
MIQPLFVFSDWALFLLRVVLGIIFIYHGFPKLKNLKATIDSFVGMGFKPGILWALLVGIIEFIGGILLIFGFLTQIVAFLFVLEFIVIIVKVKKLKNFSSFEFDLLILVSSLVLMTVGGGRFALDQLFGLFLY